MNHLTDKLVRQLTPPVARTQIRLMDDEITGFGIRVTRNAVRTFFLNYTVDGRERRMSIGRYPAWSVLAARERAKELRRQVDLGIDPMEQKDSARAMPTVKDLWDRYVREVLPTKAETTVRDQKSIFARLVLPEIGRRKVSTIDYSDVERLHGKVSKCTRVQANRMLALLRHLFGRAVLWGIIRENPASGITQNREQPRERTMSRTERERFEQALASAPDTPAKLAIEMLFLTGARKSEVLKATWDQFDEEKAVWTKPSAHTKQRMIHRVPLNGGSVEVLHRAKAFTRGKFVFPGRTGEPLSDVRGAFRRLCAEAHIEGLRIHDLRHSFASVLAEGGSDLLTIGKLLGHTQMATTLRYSHLQHETLRKAAELAWSPSER